MSTTHTSSAKAAEKTFLGHPRMLANLFNVELWERFSFYGMQAILAYYMYYTVADGGLAMDQAVALSLVGAYGGGVYLSTIVGAWIADRVLGSERVLFYSASIIMLGHISLAVLPGKAGLAVGLVLVALGSGGLKANATSLVGALYKDGDPRRDAGFTIFYMGINIGGLLGPLITGWLQTSLGFHYGFGAAAIGMALGLTVYAFGRKKLPQESHKVMNPLPRGKYPMWGGIAVAAVAVIAFALMLGIVTVDNLAIVVASVAIIASVFYFVTVLASPKVSSTERRQVVAFIPLFIASAAFWSLFQQQFTFIAVYADTKLNRNIFGWEFPASFVQSINPSFIIIFAGVLATLWTVLGTRQPSSPYKFAMGLGIIGLAFLSFIPFAGGGPGSTPLLALAGILLLFTLAELCLSPVGLSVTTKLAPAAFQTQMVALFFLSISVGSTVAGILAGMYDPKNEIPYFVMVGGIAIVLAVALAALTPALKKLTDRVL